MRSEKRQWIEILLVILTGLLKYIMIDWLEMRAFYITGISIFWSVYLLQRYAKDHAVLIKWGFRKEYFSRSFVVLMPFMIISIICAVLFGIINNRALLNWRVLPVLFLYPAWGLIQQFMMIDLIAGNLLSMHAFRIKKYQAILITAFIFSMVHQPYILLMIVTFFMEILFLIVFDRYRNLWALGIAHGWIATFILYYALNRDLWTELFAWF